MIRSMTGFGSASTAIDGVHYAVEVRSLNNRYFKAQIRLPDDLQGLEAELHTALAHAFSRGSVVLTAKYSDTSETAAAPVNVAALQRYLDALLDLPALRNDDRLKRDLTRIDLGALIALPGVVTNGTGEERVERAREPLLELTKQACERLLQMRIREGETLHRELHQHCDAIRNHLEAIDQRTPEIVQQYQDRLKQRMANLLGEAGAAVKDEDVLREVAYFAERSDIAEELARLHGHLDQFREIIDSEAEEPAGRTLDFLAQEMLREANTISSKCLDVEVSRRIVEIKSGIDRIKEQVQNVE